MGSTILLDENEIKSGISKLRRLQENISTVLGGTEAEIIRVRDFFQSSSVDCYITRFYETKSEIEQMILKSLNNLANSLEYSTELIKSGDENAASKLGMLFEDPFAGSDAIKRNSADSTDMVQYGYACSAYANKMPPVMELLEDIFGTQGTGNSGSSSGNSPVSVKYLQVESSSPYPAISAYGAKASANGSYGIASGNAHATAGLGEAYAKAVVGFEPNWNGTKAKGGKVQEVCGVDLRANAEVSAVEAGAYGQLGNNQFGVDGDLHGHGGTATAYGGFTARLDGVQQELGFRAGAEAAVAEGSASGGITLFGYELEVGVEGTFIGAGAKAELGVIDGRLKARAKAALGLGGGIFFSIGEKK